MSETRVYLAQLLCPQRHCVIAAAREADSFPADFAIAVRTTFDGAVAAGVLNPWCEICKSRNLHVEVGRTLFRTLAEAGPTLTAAEEAQRLFAAKMKSQRN